MASALAAAFLAPAERAAAQTVFVNEIHYDNAGDDIGEGIEVAAPAGTDLSAYQVVLYDGASGADYRTVGLTGIVPDEGGSGFGAVFFALPGMQNGSPDGVALLGPAVPGAGELTVIQLLSYEGTFTAAAGPAAGLFAAEIGPFEGPATAPGQSLQLVGRGATRVDFSWAGAPAGASPGQINSGQTFEAVPAPRLRLTVEPAAVAEDAGEAAAAGTVTRENGPLDEALTVLLASADPGEARVPPEVTIPAGEPAADFAVAAVADGVRDGPQEAVLTARDPAGFFAPGATVLTVLDADRAGGGGTPVRVVTFNVLDGVGSPGSPGYNAVRDILGRLDAEVVGFQEVRSTADFANLRALLADLGFTGGDMHLATSGDAFAGEPFVGGDFAGTQQVALASRHPITRAVQIGRGEAGRMELTRYPLFAAVDVPGTDFDPAFVVVHMKAGSTEADRFRKAVEAHRITQFLSAEGLGGAADNLFVLGDFNEDIEDAFRHPATFHTGIDPGTHTFGDGSRLPSTFALGPDLTEPNARTLPYRGFPDTGFIAAAVSALPTRHADGREDRTRNDFSPRRLDYILVSDAVRANGNTWSEVYNVDLDPVYGGLPKVGPPLPAGLAQVASDHFAVFGDFELDPVPALALAVFPGVVDEDAGPGAATLTVTLAVPPPAGQTLTLELSHSGAGELSLPVALAVTAPATEVSVPVDALPDNAADLDRVALLTASAPGYSTAHTPLEVRNVDAGGDLLISQHTDPPSGSSPKAIELFNNSGAPIDFAARTLEVRRFSNGSRNPTPEASLDAGRLDPGAVLVVGDAAAGQHLVDRGLLPDPGAPISSFPNGRAFDGAGGGVAFLLDPFSTNGDDAVEVRLAGVRTDVFGSVGQDPGSAWSGGGVSTADSNIALRADATLGSPGFDDPSVRFATVAAGALDGFGIPPARDDVFALWTAENGLAGDAANTRADPDSDGLTNAVEFTSASDPTDAGDAPRPAVFLFQDHGGAGTTHLALTYRALEPAGHFRHRVEVSDDLQTWFNGPAQTETLQRVDQGDGTEVITVRDARPITAGERRFIRLRLTLRRP